MLPFRRRSSVKSRPGSDLQPCHHALDGDPDDGDGNKNLPAQAHDLVVAIPRKGRPEPEKCVHEEGHLDEQPREAAADDPAEPQVVVPGLEVSDALERRRPAAQEEHGCQCRDQDHVGVFGQEEDRECHARILDMEAGNDLRLAFGNVEGRAVGLGNARDPVNKK